MKQNQKPRVGETQTQLEQRSESLPVIEFVKIEKNLISFGFFTPSNKKIRGVKKKTITFTRMIDGKKAEARAHILPSAEYGLPVTADQDKWLAWQKFTEDLRQQIGEVRNPVGFSSAELLRLLGKRVRTGKNYDDIAEWLKRMTLTGISSEGVVYLAGKKKWVTDTFHVFERSITFGQELPDGGVADKNYVWLSEWQLENINNNYLLPVDFETYKQLKTHIAKALVPLLQIWLYASRDEGSFEKRYDELCQILNIRQYQHLSKIKEKFAPSLEELKAHGYIADWQIEKLSEGKGYKIIFRHGEKFHRDRKRRLAQKEGRTSPPPRQLRLITEPPAEEQGIGELQSVSIVLDSLTEEERSLIKQLNMDFGVMVLKAAELVRGNSEQVRAQLEAFPYRNASPANPAGFIIDAIENNYALPESYLAAKRQQTEQKQLEQQKAATAACTLCTEAGFRYLENKAVKKCTHDPVIEAQWK